MVRYMEFPYVRKVTKLQASYAALAVQTRELLIIIMWMGQFAGEVLNWTIKHIIKQERPPGMFCLFIFLGGRIVMRWYHIGHVGNGYGFPSSHSQYMAYFSSFLICHLYFRHQFAFTEYPIIDFIWRATVYSAL